MIRSLVVLMLVGCSATLDTDPPHPDGALGDLGVDGAEAPVMDAAAQADADPGTDAALAPDAREAADGEAPEPDMMIAPDVALPPDMAPPPPPIPARDCVFAAENGAEQGLDVGPNSPERLRFEVRALPDPGLIDRAVLTFAGYDLDHPGEEGVIYVNGRAFDLPADINGDNQASMESVDITGATAADRNIIEFGPGPLERSFFRISDVAVAVQARVEDCPDGPPPPPPLPPEAVVREILYPDARYTNRPTWVVGCLNNPARRYAFTARGNEHIDTDCDGLYREGGNREGDAIFLFENVVGRPTTSSSTPATRRTGTPTARSSW